jgi:hypothetical protein
MAPSRVPVDSVAASVEPVVGTVVAAVVSVDAEGWVAWVGLDVSPLVGRVGTLVLVFIQPQPTSVIAPRARAKVKKTNFFIGKPPIFLVAYLLFPDLRPLHWEYQEKWLQFANFCV